MLFYNMLSIHARWAYAWCQCGLCNGWLNAVVKTSWPHDLKLATQITKFFQRAPLSHLKLKVSFGYYRADSNAWLQCRQSKVTGGDFSWCYSFSRLFTHKNCYLLYTQISIVNHTFFNTTHNPLYFALFINANTSLCSDRTHCYSNGKTSISKAVVQFEIKALAI